MRITVRLLPSFGAFAWLLWFCVQAKWSEVIAPNFWWLILGTVIATCIAWLLTGERKSKALVIRPEEKSIVSQERLVAKETYTWKTVIREREIYRR